MKVDQAFLGNFVASEKIKITELGREKLAIDLDNPGQVIDGLRTCFKSGGASPTASSSSPITPSIKALEGKWYSDSQSVCKGRAGETEGLLTFQETRFIGYENDCKIVNAKVTGRLIALQMVCSAEGMQTRTSEVIEFLGDRKIRRAVRDNGKTYSFVHSRCP
ncbi:hypothetical protein BraRD5C2_55500 [Bradyrhizobium sp. RD5-C2]|nr:hypothetical protein BraRD5C2_55500 [Bradyrhizobium sp. RD5-C2]